MPYLAEAILFLSPFALYALWLRFNPGRAVGSHVIALALVGLAIGIGGAVLYGLSRGMDPNAVYVPPRVTAEGIEPGHAAPAGPAPPRPSGPALSPPPPHEGPPRR